MALQHRWAPAALAVALTIGFTAGAEQPPKVGEVSVDAARVERGRQLYALRCSHCHGINMVTAGNVTFDLRGFPRDQQERFFESVTNGKNSRMPPWGDVLTQEEIGDIWSFVRTRIKP
jgi:cytochrome c55X